MSDRLGKLRKKKEQLDARIKQAEAKDRTRERKKDARRKIILGAILGEWMTTDEALMTKVNEQLERTLTRGIDRELFGLPVMKSADKKTEGNESPEESAA